MTRLVGAHLTLLI